MYVSKTQIRVRYAETDQMGVVYHANFATYFEVARVEALRQMGLTYKSIEESGIMMPVLNIHMQYHKPARYDDLLTVDTILNALPSIKIKFDFKVYNESNELLCTGDVTLFFMDKQSGKPVKCPEILLEKLTPYFTSD